MRRIAPLALAMAALAAACSGPGEYRDPSPSPSPSPVAAATLSPSTDPAALAPTEFRVAFINLMSPVGLDANNTVPGDTFDDRLAAVIDELKAFKPDLVGFNEATVTKAHGGAAAVLARELHMEIQYVRANPWFPGQTRDQNDALAKQIGFEEGDVILSRSAFPILRAEPKWLNPRTSETEGRAGFHVVLKGPPSLGDVDVYITHLTGGGEKIRSQQAQSFASWVTQTRGGGPLVLMGDIGDLPGTATYAVFTAAGLTDLAVDGGAGTCCRESVLGEQPPLTQRTDFLFVANLPNVPIQLFADKPHTRADGSLLYASDHNGLEAVFPLK